RFVLHQLEPYWNTRPAQQGAYSSLGLGADVSGAVLGNFTLGLGYVERLNDSADSIFLRGSFDFAPFRAYGVFDPARRPLGDSWELGIEYKAGNIWNPFFAARLSVDALAVGVAAQRHWDWSNTRLSSSLELRFGYAPSLRLQGSLSVTTDFKPFFVRTRALLGLTTGGAEGFSFGYHSFLRGYPANFTVARQAVIGNLELGYKLELPSVAGILSAVPELRLFWDMGWALDVNIGQNQWLWSAGLGVNFPGAWFGFLPFGMGMDLAFSPVGVRLIAYTALRF
ncbi:MAG: hypothetical protein ACK41E_09940, partial [Deinococcales bacterium]